MTIEFHLMNVKVLEKRFKHLAELSKTAERRIISKDKRGNVYQEAYTLDEFTATRIRDELEDLLNQFTYGDSTINRNNHKEGWWFSDDHKRIQNQIAEEKRIEAEKAKAIADKKKAIADKKQAKINKKEREEREKKEKEERKEWIKAAPERKANEPKPIHSSAWTNWEGIETVPATWTPYVWDEEKLDWTLGNQQFAKKNGKYLPWPFAEVKQ